MHKQILKSLRKEKNWSTKDLAKEIGKSHRTVEKYESGELNIPRSVEIILKYIIKRMI